MIPFPLLLPAIFSAQRVAMPCVAFAPREKQCSSSRSNWTSRLPRFHLSRSLPNAASRKRFAPPPKERQALVPSAFAARCSALIVPALALHPGCDSLDRFPFRPCPPLLELRAAPLPCAAGACGQSHS